MWINLAGNMARLLSSHCYVVLLLLLLLCVLSTQPVEPVCLVVSALVQPHLQFLFVCLFFVICNLCWLSFIKATGVEITCWCMFGVSGKMHGLWPSAYEARLVVDHLDHLKTDVTAVGDSKCVSTSDEWNPNLQ